MDPKFPNAHVQLTGEDGNVFAIIGRMRNGLLQAGATEDEVREFTREIMSGDYNHALLVCAEWADIL